MKDRDREKPQFLSGSSLMPKDAGGCEEADFLLELIVMRQRTGWKSCTQSQPQ